MSQDMRAAHSFIHVNYNRVKLRFLVYAASTLLLIGLWGAYTTKLLSHQASPF
jgi:hypothetical protein